MDARMWLKSEPPPLSHTSYPGHTCYPGYTCHTSYLHSRIAASSRNTAPRSSFAGFKRAFGHRVYTCPLRVLIHAFAHFFPNSVIIWCMKCQKMGLHRPKKRVTLFTVRFSRFISVFCLPVASSQCNTGCWLAGCAFLM